MADRRLERNGGYDRSAWKRRRHEIIEPTPRATVVGELESVAAQTAGRKGDGDKKDDARANPASASASLIACPNGPTFPVIALPFCYHAPGSLLSPWWRLPKPVHHWNAWAEALFLPRRARIEWAAFQRRKSVDHRRILVDTPSRVRDAPSASRSGVKPIPRGVANARLRVPKSFRVLHATGRVERAHRPFGSLPDTRQMSRARGWHLKTNGSKYGVPEPTTYAPST